MNDFDFDDLLRAIREEVSVPASFNFDVWDRISSKNEVPQGIIRFQVFAGGLAGPWGAAAGIAVMVTLGLWLGSMGLQNPRNSEVAYAMSISPFSQAHRK